jgi:hypothetical protein
MDSVIYLKETMTWDLFTPHLSLESSTYRPMIHTLSNFEYAFEFDRKIRIEDDCAQTFEGLVDCKHL